MAEPALPQAGTPNGQPAGAAAGTPTAPSAPSARRDPSYCRAPADIYATAARRVAARAAASYLDQVQLTPLELLHHHEHATKFANAGTTLTAAVQQVAIEQVKATGQSVSERVRELFTYTDAALVLSKSLSEAQASSPALTVERLNELAASEDTKPAYAALAKHLADATTWPQKIERIVALLAPALSAPAEILLDELLAEVMNRPAALNAVLDPAATAEARIILLIAMLRREPIPGEPSPLRDLVAGVLARRELPICRIAMTTLALRDLATSHRLTSSKPDEELGGIRRVAAAFGKGGLKVSDEMVNKFIEKRYSRAVTMETLPELVSQSAPLAFKIDRLVELVDQVVGATPREVLLKYLKFLFEQRDFEKDIMTGKDDATVEAKLEAMIKRFENSTMPQTRRAHYLEQLRGVLNKIRSGDRRNGGRAGAAAADYVMFDGERVPLRNWSTVGLLFGPVAAQLKPDQKLRVVVRVRTDRGPLQFDAEATVVRSQDGEVAAKYQCVNQSHDKIIQGHFARRAERKQG